MNTRNLMKKKNSGHDAFSTNKKGLKTKMLGMMLPLLSFKIIIIII